MITGYTKHTGPIPKYTHKELVDMAFLYLKNTNKHTVVFRERVGSTSENPDVIGFSSYGDSTLIECKTSRGDFLADSKKSFRSNPEQGMGYMRYYMAPVGLLIPKEMPEGWGLLEVHEKPKRKGWSGKIVQSKISDRFYNRNNQAETNYLVSAIRRIEISMAVFFVPESPQ